jgi:hypothetical protein
MPPKSFMYTVKIEPGYRGYVTRTIFWEKKYQMPEKYLPGDPATTH